MDDNMNIRFLGEAYETFQRTVQDMHGYGVTIKLADGEPFDAMLVAPDYDAEDGATIRFVRDPERFDYVLTAEALQHAESAVTEWIEVS